MEPEIKRATLDSDDSSFDAAVSRGAAGKSTPSQDRYGLPPGNGVASSGAAPAGAASEGHAPRVPDMFGGLLGVSAAEPAKKPSVTPGVTFAKMIARAKHMVDNIRGNVPDPAEPVRDDDQAASVALDILDEVSSKLASLEKELAAFEQRIGDAGGSERAALNKEFDRIQSAMDTYLYRVETLLISAQQGLRGSQARATLRAAGKRLWSASEKLATRRWGFRP